MTGLSKEVTAMWNDDITFCLDSECKLNECPRNQINMRDRSIPHSYSLERPEDCLKERKSKNEESK